jgi:hypothetical protein
MCLDRRQLDSDGNRGAIRLLPELAASLPAISHAPLTGQDPEWRPTEINLLPTKLHDLASGFSVSP